MSGDRVRAFRLARHRLAERAPPGSLVEVARELGGLHAQLASSAELSLCARVEGLEPGDVREALERERSLVKTWAMRGTLHLLPAADLAIYVAALGPQWDKPGGAWLRGHGIRDAEVYEAIVSTVPRVLDGRPRTRTELADRLAEQAGEHVRELLLSGWGALLKPSAHRGDLCFGKNRGRNVTFVRPDRWLRRRLKVDPDEGPRELVRRYLRAYGPATADDFSRWIGIRGATPKRMLAALGDELAEVEAAGRVGSILAADVEALRAAGKPRGVRLLPAFDPYVVGFRPRAELVAAEHEARIFRPQGWISPVVLVDGRAAGVWSHEQRRGSVEVAVEPFSPLSARVRKALAAEADRLGDFLGAPAALSWT